MLIPICFQDVVGFRVLAVPRPALEEPQRPVEGPAGARGDGPDHIAGRLGAGAPAEEPLAARAEPGAAAPAVASAPTGERRELAEHERTAAAASGGAHPPHAPVLRARHQTQRRQPAQQLRRLLLAEGPVHQDGELRPLGAADLAAKAHAVGRAQCAVVVEHGEADAQLPANAAYPSVGAAAESPQSHHQRQLRDERAGDANARRGRGQLESLDAKADAQRSAAGRRDPAAEDTSRQFTDESARVRQRSRERPSIKRDQGVHAVSTLQMLIKIMCAAEIGELMMQLGEIRRRKMA